nr:PC4/YdbC family ssDNA-binding protein [uncultured Aminipila sp.]
MAEKKEVQKEIIEEIGVISTTVGGWRTELNLMSWNGGAVKYDIRAWNEDHSKCSRGVTLTSEELFKLKDLLNQKLGR